MVSNAHSSTPNFSRLVLIMFGQYYFVNYRTPMMDLLVQITSAHRINPGGHVIQVMNDRSDDYLYYKPSTPIGKGASKCSRILHRVLQGTLESSVCRT